MWTCVSIPILTPFSVRLSVYVTLVNLCPAIKWKHQKHKNTEKQFLVFLHKLYSFNFYIAYLPFCQMPKMLVLNPPSFNQCSRLLSWPGPPASFLDWSHRSIPFLGPGHLNLRLLLLFPTWWYSWCYSYTADTLLPLVLELRSHFRSSFWLSWLLKLLPANWSHRPPFSPSPSHPSWPRFPPSFPSHSLPRSLLGLSTWAWFKLLEQIPSHTTKGSFSTCWNFLPFPFYLSSLCVPFPQ